MKFVFCKIIFCCLHYYQVDHILPRGGRLIACFIRYISNICVFYARRTGTPSHPFQGAVMHYIISVEHVLRPGSHDYIILYYIILYFNPPCKAKSKDFVQFIFLHSSRKVKSMDFLQLNLMIFLL